MGQIFVWEELSLLYRVATQTDLATLPISLPDRALTELLQCTIILDIEYGKDRDPMQSGGYSLIAETSADLEEVKKTINYDTHPCEWATRLGNSGYLSALYLFKRRLLYRPVHAHQHRPGSYLKRFGGLT